MSWNYRVAKKIVNGKPSYGIVEVYYDKNHEVTGWSDFIDLNGWDNIDDLEGTIKLMLKAFDRPMFEELVK